MKKLIKLSDIHYIIVDDSEIKEDDYFYHPNKALVTQIEKCNKIEIHNFICHINDFIGYVCKKITHSTQPLEISKGHSVKGGGLWTFEDIKQLSLSEVEEVINGCSLDNKIAKHLEKNHIEASPKRVQVVKSLVEELVKDKLFAVEDLRAAFTEGNAGRGGYTYNRVREFDGFDEYITKKLGYFWDSEKGYVLPPKTEWDIEINEHNKITLL